MKAILVPEYGSPDVLQFTDVEKPVPNEDQVLVKIVAAAANPWTGMACREPFLVRMSGEFRRPKDLRLGADIAGRVEAVGKNITEFKPGDEVFGAVGVGGLPGTSVLEKNLALKPANVSFEQAAAAPVVGYTAIQGFRHAGGIGQDKRFWSTGRQAGLVRLPCSMPNRVGRKSPACAAHETWTWCVRSAPTTRWITPGKISPEPVSVMISFIVRSAIARSLTIGARSKWKVCDCRLYPRCVCSSI